MAESNPSKPLCYTCVHRRTIPGDCHSSCAAPNGTIVKGDTHGVKSGWFMYPYNFDPIWLMECNSYLLKPN